MLGLEFLKDLQLTDRKEKGEEREKRKGEEEEEEGRGGVVALLCRGGTCSLPVDNAQALRELLDRPV
jgi:hypothetical protein